MKTSFCRALLFSTLLALPSMAIGKTVTVSDVARELICQCGCNKVLDVCEMSGWAKPHKELIQERLLNGQTKAEIISFFVEQYGEKVLAAPTKKGFNLSAWITPFAALIAGGTGLFYLIRRWLFIRRRSVGEELSRARREDSHGAYGERFEEEFQEFLRGGGMG
ncbi:MAG: cytochrome c-type biogenesis protein CcmH [Nitrospinota bacterium]